MDELRWTAYAPMLQPSPLNAYRPPVRWERRGSLVLMDGIPPGDGPQLVCAFGAEPPFARVLAEAEVFYGGPAAYELCIDADLRAAEEPLLRQHGFVQTEEEPGLVLPRLPAPPDIPAAPPELEIRLVRDEAGLEAFFSVTRTPRSIIPSLAAARDPGVGLLVGWVDGQAVATSRFSLAGGIVDIMGVTTIEDARRRGYATALTWAAVAEAARRGATAATLTATEMGYPVYLKMGFLRACTFRSYQRGSQEEEEPR